MWSVVRPARRLMRIRDRLKALNRLARLGVNRATQPPPLKPTDPGAWTVSQSLMHAVKSLAAVEPMPGKKVCLTLCHIITGTGKESAKAGTIEDAIQKAMEEAQANSNKKTKK